MSTAIDFAEMLREARAAAAAASSAAASSAGASAVPLAAHAGAQNPSEAAEASSAQVTRTMLEESFRVSGAPNTVYVVPEYVSHAEEEALLDLAARYGTYAALDGRRVKHWGGIPSVSEPMRRQPLPARAAVHCTALERLLGKRFNHFLVNEYSRGQGIGWHNDGPLYESLVAVISLGENASIEFRPRNPKISGRAAEASRLASASLGGDPTMEANPGATRGERSDHELHLGDAGAGGQPALQSVWLPRRSLLVFCNEAYEDYLHRVPAVTHDTLADGTIAERVGTRVSFTVREVKNVVEGESRAVTENDRDEERRRMGNFLRGLSSS